MRFLSRPGLRAHQFVPGVPGRIMEQLFKFGVMSRSRLYQWGILPIRTLGHPVVSVGNLTAGGTGKSPLVAFLASHLQAGGYAPAILSRGYGRGSASKTILVSDGTQVFADFPGAGDEALMLARQSPGTAVAVGPDRYRTGRLIEEALPTPSRVFLLDDGFQHRKLHRAVDLVTVDASTSLSDVRLLPAGPWREPASSLTRCDAVCLTRCHLASADVSRRIREIRQISPYIPIFEFTTQVQDLSRIGSDQTIHLAEAAGRKIVAVAALGSPSQFLQDLGRNGLRVVNEFLFPDHHPFSQTEIDLIRERASRLGAAFVLTTEKDAIRLESLDLAGFPFLALRIRFSVGQPASFREWLGDRLDTARQAVHSSRPATEAPARPSGPVGVQGLQQESAQEHEHDRD